MDAMLMASVDDVRSHCTASEPLRAPMRVE
jgi:hypothetical protein